MLWRTKQLIPYQWSVLFEGGQGRPYYRPDAKGHLRMVYVELFDNDGHSRGTVERKQLPLRSGYAWDQIASALSDRDMQYEGTDFWMDGDPDSETP